MRDEASAKDYLTALSGNDPIAMQRLTLMIELLTEENRQQNLISTASQGEAWRRHVADSAQLLRFVGTPTSWLDLGSGAGFPGMVIAILRPELSVTLVEARRRRSEWLRRVCTELDLSSVEVAALRVEDLPARTFDVISARAFAPMERLLAAAHHLSTPQTVWVLPKGRRAVEEVSAIGDWHHRFHVEQSLTDDDAGIIVGTLQGRKNDRDNAGHR